MVGSSAVGRQRDRRGWDKWGKGDREKRGRKGGGGREGKGRKDRRGRKGKERREISPPRSFLKVGVYAVHHCCCLL